MQGRYALEVARQLNAGRMKASSENSNSNNGQRPPGLVWRGVHGDAWPPLAGDIKVRTTSKLVAIVFLIILCSDFS